MGPPPPLEAPPSQFCTLPPLMKRGGSIGGLVPPPPIPVTYGAPPPLEAPPSQSPPETCLTIGEVRSPRRVLATLIERPNYQRSHPAEKTPDTWALGTRGADRRFGTPPSNSGHLWGPPPLEAPPSQFCTLHGQQGGSVAGSTSPPETCLTIGEVTPPKRPPILGPLSCPRLRKLNAIQTEAIAPERSTFPNEV